MSGQSRKGSLVETCINTAIGFIVNLAIAPTLYLLFGHSFTLQQNIGLSAAFTAISIARGYVVRRWFEKGIRRAAERLTQQ